MAYQSAWDIEKIRIGFERFFTENGRLPTALEVDKIDYLPSSRQIQRLFGGLPKLRKELGYSEINFSKGENRSRIAFKSYKLSRTSEQNLQEHLREYFHEVFVHIERPVRGSKVRLDFYVYNRTENFGVDVFTTENMYTLRSNLFIKLRKYSDFKEPLFLVVDSPSIKGTDIEGYNLGKTGELLPNARLITLDSFLVKMKEFLPYENPIEQKRGQSGKGGQKRGQVHFSVKTDIPDV